MPLLGSVIKLFKPGSDIDDRLRVAIALNNIDPEKRIKGQRQMLFSAEFLTQWAVVFPVLF